MPSYIPGTPKIGAESGDVCRLNGETLAAAAASREAISFVADLLARLTPSEDIVGLQALYRSAQDRFGGYWRYVDILTVLWAAATLIQPKSYLEIGVRRGRSTAVVAAACPDCAIYGFDLWVPEYFGAPNPGPDLVRSELAAVGHRGSLVLVTGDSHETVPAFLRQHPDLYFDLITIDGDKSLVGSATDFANALPRLSVGAIVLCDDLPWFPALRRVWDRVICSDSRYVRCDFAGYGEVAAAIRISDEPWLAAMGRLG
jgi:predicted O-methyltransferase YrrM